MIFLSNLPRLPFNVSLHAIDLISYRIMFYIFAQVIETCFDIFRFGIGLIGPMKIYGKYQLTFVQGLKLSLNIFITEIDQMNSIYSIVNW